MSIALSVVCPTKPELTESTLPDQSGKVFIVTGSSGGIGKELARILYQKNATVYVATRSQAKAEAAIQDIRKSNPTSTGRLVFLHLDLGDLAMISRSADEFLSKEKKLDVLWNNAGVMIPPQGSKTTQGYELQLGTNNLGPFLFTKLLYPILVATAKTAARNSVRIVWVSSGGSHRAPTPAIDFGNMDYHRDEGPYNKYYRSKAGNILHSVEAARRSREAGDNVISLAVDPGVNSTDLARTMPSWQRTLFKPLLHEPKFGAYTELFAGLHHGITQEQSGGWIIPQGRLATDHCRKDLLDREMAIQFWDWSEAQIKPFL